MYTQTSGQRGEATAAHFLQQRGLRLRERNYACRLGEIDLVMQEDDSLVFVEVRYRSNPTRGDGVESVTAAKQKKLTKAALHYLQRHKLLDRVPCRFDVVAIDAKQHVNWIKDAFEAASF